MPAENAEATRAARAQVTRRNIDSSMLEVRVTGGICTMTGIVRALRSHPDVEMKAEMDHISHALRGKAGIRDIIWDVTIRS